MEGSSAPSTVLWWVLTLAWAALIFHLSSQAFAPEFSGAFLAAVLHLFHLRVSAGAFAILHGILRKVAHLTEYAIFALFLYGRPGEDWHWRPRRAIICILVAAAYSLTDEFHQSFVPGRHSSILDCGLDTVGASLAMVVPYAVTQVSLLRSTISPARVPVV